MEIGGGPLNTSAVTHGHRAIRPALGAAAQAVYRCFASDGQLLYVGTTGHLGRRLAQHAEKIWFLDVCGITLEWYPDEQGALDAERIAIHIEQPKYNQVHKAGQLSAAAPRRISARRGAEPAPPAALPYGVARTRQAERITAFYEVVRNAPRTGLTPLDLVRTTGMSRSWVHLKLAEMNADGTLEKVGRGCYRPVRSVPDDQ